MATNERRALMRHLGLKLLEHAAVETRDLLDSWTNRPTDKKIAILKDFDGLELVWAGDPSLLERDYSFTRAGDEYSPAYANYINAYFGRERSVHAYADWPVRIEGMFSAGVSGSYRIYEVDRYGNQYYWTIRNGAARRYDVRANDMAGIDLRGLRRITTRDIPSRDRASFMYGYATLLQNQGNYDRQRFGEALQQRLIASGYHPDRTNQSYWRDPMYITGYRSKRGIQSLYATEYLGLRRQLKEIGGLIAKRDTDTKDFLSAVANFNDDGYGHHFYNHLLRAWTKVHPEKELVNCYCGHMEEQAHATEIRNGRYACRACMAAGRFHFMDDLQQYDAGGYQWSDGLYRSYAEPQEYDPDSDDEDDDYPTPGVRNYSTDVRTLLLPDRTIKPSSYGEFLMGIELEVVPNDYRADAVEHTMENLAKGYAILKNDGSLDDGGFEIVTAPRGLKEHIQRFSDWKPYRTLRAWDAGCCGTHVHISSQAFTQATLGKFIEFINSERNDNFIRSIAGRHPHFDGQAADYCQRDGCEPGNPKKTLEHKETSRYFMVNTTNLSTKEAMRLGLSPDHAVGRPQNTIELRVFRASLKKARLLAQIEFAHAAVMFCRWSSMRELDEKHFLKWLKGMAGVYPNLAKWYGVRANTEAVEEAPKVRTTGVDV